MRFACKFKYLDMLACTILTLLMLGLCESTKNRTEITLGVLAGSKRAGLKNVYFLPPFTIGLEYVQDTLHVPVTFKYIFESTGDDCGRSVMLAPGVAVDMFNKHNIQAFFGPVCSAETVPVADLATYWNIPILSAVSASSSLDSKIRYKTLTRTSYKMTTISNFILSVCVENQWKTVAIILDKTTRVIYWPIAAESISNILVDSDIAAVHRVDMMDTGRKALADAVARGRSKC